MDTLQQSTVSETFKLKRFTLIFKNGYQSLNTVDRYEGEVTFTNDENHSFILQIDDIAGKKILATIADQLNETAKSLSKGIVDAVNVQIT